MISPDTQALLDQATRRPWRADTNHDGCKQIRGAKAGTHKQAQYRDVAYTPGLSNESEDRANAALIVVAVNDYERLLRDRAERDTLREALREVALLLDTLGRWFIDANPDVPRALEDAVVASVMRIEAALSSPVTEEEGT